MSIRKITFSNKGRGVNAFLLLLLVVIVVLGSISDASMLEAQSSKSGAFRSNNRGQGRSGRRRPHGRRKTSTLGVTVDPNPHPCRPRAQAVPLPPAPPGKFYIPSCAVVKRCSGCCSLSSFECVPQRESKEEKVKWKTNEYVMGINGKWKFNGVISFDVTDHRKCSCGCKVRAEHCTKLQVYDPLNCQCGCTNRKDLESCEEPKYWDPNDCACRCPSSSLECTTGTYMDPNSCRCITGEHIIEIEKAARKLSLPDIYRI